MSAGSSVRQGRRDKSGIRYGSDDGARQANPTRVANKISEIQADVDGEELPEPLLPGFGSRRETCGDDIPRFCADCGATHSVGRTCYMVECPRCYRAWARRRATKITAKLEALRRYKESARPGWDGWKFHHIVLSPPEGYEVDSDEPLKRTFELVKEICDDMGIPTGVVFGHPYRGENGDDRGFWKDLLPDGDEVPFSGVREQLSHEFHFHAVVLSKYVTGGEFSKAVEERTGWLLKRITKGGDESDSDVSIYDQYDLARTVAYCLSHTGVDMSGDTNRSMYRYFGELHNFTATPKIEAHMDAAVRSVSPKTLGLEKNAVACSSTTTSPLETDDGRSSTKVQVDRAEAASSVTTTTASDDELAEPDDTGTAEVEERCNGRNLDIKKAPAFLDDPEWMERAENAEQLVETWKEWREDVDGVRPSDSTIYTGYVDNDDIDRPPD